MPLSRRIHRGKTPKDARYHTDPGGEETGVVNVGKPGYSAESVGLHDQQGTTGATRGNRRVDGFLFNLLFGGGTPKW